jgi:hypothetical protein
LIISVKEAKHVFKTFMIDDVKPFGSVKAAWMNAIDNNVIFEI